MKKKFKTSKNFKTMEWLNGLTYYTFKIKKLQIQAPLGAWSGLVAQVPFEVQSEAKSKNNLGD